MKKKIRYIIHDISFPTSNNPWQNQKIQRDFIIKKLDFVNDDDFVFFYYTY